MSRLNFVFRVSNVTSVFVVHEQTNNKTETAVSRLSEPSHEIMVLFVFRKLILQTHMRRHPVGLDV